MKKLFILSIFCLLTTMVFGQANTANFQYYKVKPGHRGAFNEALKNHTTKFRKAGTATEWAIFNLVGGSHHGEVMSLYNIGTSWAKRDELGATPTNTEAADDFYLKVSPHIESITGGEIISYQADYSNSNPSERSAKIRSSILTLKYAPATEFWDVIKRLPKVWDKAGMKIATYTTSGQNRLVFSRRFPNGWKELDELSTLKTAYDEVYGKGAYEKDMAIMRTYVVENETSYMTLQPDLSSK